MYIEGMGLVHFVPFLDLVHRILVASDTVHHIYGEISTSKWDGGKMYEGGGA
jgi:hypothetical protein